MTKEKMMENVVRRYGLEDKLSIWFCRLAETLTEGQLLDAYIILEMNKSFRFLK